MWPRSVLLVGGAGLSMALVLLATQLSKGDASTLAGRPPPAWGTPQSAPAPAGWANPGAAPPAVVLPAPGAPAAPARAAGVVRLTVAAPQTLHVGELHELLIGMGANADVAEVRFTVQFDPDVLQVRAGTAGDWAAEAGGSASFTAEISSREDSVQVRSYARNPRWRGNGGSVALVQFQAMAPGTTTVLISDVTVRDPAGNAVHFVLSSSSLQITAQSTPPPRPELPRPAAAPSGEPASTGD